MEQVPQAPALRHTGAQRDHEGSGCQGAGIHAAPWLSRFRWWPCRPLLLLPVFRLVLERAGDRASWPTSDSQVADWAHYETGSASDLGQVGRLWMSPLRPAVSGIRGAWSRGWRLEEARVQVLAGCRAGASGVAMCSSSGAGVRAAVLWRSRRSNRPRTVLPLGCWEPWVRAWPAGFELNYPCLASLAR